MEPPQSPSSKPLRGNIVSISYDSGPIIPSSRKTSHSNIFARATIACECLVCHADIVLFTYSSRPTHIEKGFINAVCSLECREVYRLNPLPYAPFAIDPIVADPSEVPIILKPTVILK